MPSDKLIAILRSKTSLTDETISAMSEAEGWNAVYALGTTKTPKPPTICLTGFGQAERQDLEQAAAARGYKVVGSVSRDLRFLFAGETPGPAKLAKAAEMGIRVATAEDLRALLAIEPAPV